MTPVLPTPTDPDARPQTLRFHGGAPGALVPFVLFLAGVSWLGLNGAPDETGFWPVLLVAIGIGLALATDRALYAEAVIEAMGHRIVMLLIVSWLLAGVLGVLLRESGLIQALVAAATAGGVRGGGFVVSVFLVCSVFATATGTSLGTLLVCAPLLYPAGTVLGGDPAFTIGAILAGATFGDNVSPISDTTIASATTQGADMGGVVRSRMAYALPAGAIAIACFALWGGRVDEPDAALAQVVAEADMMGLSMLAIPALVLTLLLRRRHLVEGLFAGIGLAVVLGLATGRFGAVDLFAVDPDNFVATGLLLDGMRRAVGVSIFTLLLMGLVGGIEASGLIGQFMRWVEARASNESSAEWWIFGSISGATLLTTHSAVAILTVGPLARKVGESAGVGAYRRANILDVAVCTYPFLLPFFIPTILAAAMTSGAEGLPRVSAWDAGLHNVHSWALLAVLTVSIAFRRSGRRSDVAL